MTSLKQKRFVDTDYFHQQLDSTMVEVEGSYISATDTKIGYTTDIEIKGNTIQDAENLADIRSVGDKVEGQELYEIPVVSCGKNLFDKLNLENGSISNGFVDNNFLDTRCRTTNYIKVSPNTNYVISKNTSQWASVSAYDSEYKFLYLLQDIDAKIITFATTEEVKYIKVKFDYSLATALSDNIQLEKGTQATPYEEYKESRTKITLPCQLEKVGDVADRIICKDGVWGVEKNIVTHHLKDYAHSDYNGFACRTTLPNACITKDIYTITPFYTDLDWMHTEINYQWNNRNINSIAINSDVCDITSENYVYQDIIKMIEENDIWVKYPILNPTFIPLPHDQQVKLRTFAGQTNIHFETEIEGTIKCKVPKSVGGTLESLVEKAKITDDRLEIIENVAEGQNMQYSTDNGIIHCTNTKKGKVKDLVIEGNTLVNYAKDGSKTLTLNGEIDEKGTHITTTNAVNNGLVDVMCEGETLVNVCNQKDPVAITKSYTVENTNHVPLQGEYDGKARPVVEGNTLVNLYDCPLCNTLSNHVIYNDRAVINYDLFKPNTTYTVISIGSNKTTRLSVCNQSGQIKWGEVTGNIGTFTTPETFDRTVALRVYNYSSLEDDIYTSSDLENIQNMIFEGDLTANPPSEYIEGLKSSFEDQYIPVNLNTAVPSLNNNWISKNGDYITFNNPTTSGNVSWYVRNKLKPNTTYTLISECTEIFNDGYILYVDMFPDTYSEIGTVTKAGKISIKFTTPADISTLDAIRFYVHGATSGIATFKVPLIIEGDYTSNPPTYEEVVNHSGKYKVEYKVTGKNKFNFVQGNIDGYDNQEELITIDYVNKTITGDNNSTNYRDFQLFVYLKANKSYVLSYKGVTISGINTQLLEGKCNGYDSNKTIGHINNGILPTVTKDGWYTIHMHSLHGTMSEIQVEEGTVATEYEAYKEYTKTFYLNSPLLEGDTIEDINGKATHIKRYKQVVFNGSENWWDNEPMSYAYLHLNALGCKSLGNIFCDTLKVGTSFEGDIFTGTVGLGIHYNDTNRTDLAGLKAWLQANPTTVVYELETPIYETISEESILCDSYVNGHLDVDTNVPINKVNFGYVPIKCVYLVPNTLYTVQFHSDNIGKLYKMYLGASSSLTDLDVVKGVNTFTFSTGNTVGFGYLDLYGIGFNASNISVVATEREFNYFEGLYSVGQDDVNGHNIEILSSTGRPNLIKNSGFLQGITNHPTYYSTHLSATQEIVGEPTAKSGKALKITSASSGGVSGVFQSGIVSEIKDKKYVFSGWCKGDVGKTLQLHLERHKATSITFTNANEWVKFTVVSEQNPTDWNRTITMYSSSIDSTFYVKDIKVEEYETDTPYIPHISESNYSKFINTKTLTLKEPLRSVGDVKDKIVKIGGKWYIERNCGEIDYLTSIWSIYTANNLSNCVQFLASTNFNKFVDNTQICDKLKPIDTTKVNANSQEIGPYCVSLGYQLSIYMPLGTTLDQFNTWLSKNNPVILAQLATPIYEELEVEPVLTTYVDQTYISTNSVIPCDMTVKNSGYDVIIKPSTLYTVALDTSGEVELNLGGSKVTTNNGVAKILTPSTLVDDSLRISGKGLTSSNVRVLEGDNTHFIPSYFEGLKSSFEDTKQGDNHIVEVVSNNKNLFNCESIIKKDLVYPGTNKSYRVVFSKVKQNTEYTVTGTFAKSTTTNGHGGIRIALYKDIPQEIDSWYQTQKSLWIWQTEAPSSNINTTFNSRDYNYVGVYVAIATGTANNYTATLTNLQLTEGGKFNYIEPNENKLQFSTLAPLRSVGDISDKLVFKDNKWMIERNCGEVILDGNKDYVGEMYKDGENYLQFNLKFDKHSLNDFVAYSDRFVNVEFTNQYNSEGFSMHRQKLIVLKILKTKLSTQDLKGLKEWLSENPTTIVYQLAEPYYEEIGEYRNLDSYDEGTTIYANTLIAPSHLGFKLSSHISNIVRDIQDDVSDLKTWRSEIFDSITHTKTFDNGFTTVEDTKEGVVNEVKLEGKTLVNLCKTPINFSGNSLEGSANRICSIILSKNTVIDKEYTIVLNITKDEPTEPLLIQFKGDLEASNTNWISNSGIYKLKIKANNTYDTLWIYGLDGSGITYIIKDVIILEGDHTQNPPEYFEGLMSVGQDVEEVSIESVNDGINNSNNQFKEIVMNTGVEENHLGAIVSTYNYISVDGNNIKLYRNGIETIESNNLKKRYYRKDKTYIGPQFTNDAYYVRFRFITSNGSAFGGDISEYKILDVGLNEQVCNKKPLLYYNPTTETWEKPVLRQWDSIEKHSNGKYYYHKRSGEVVLNGSENWEQMTFSVALEDYLGFGTPIENGKITDVSTNYVIDTHGFANLELNTINNNGFLGEALTVHSNGNLYIRFLKSRISSQNVEGFKEWLQDNNVTVVYQLAQEEVYEVANIELNSYDGETNIIVNSGAISPITTVSLTSNLPQVAENLRNRVRQLEEEVYNYQVVQNLRQLRTFYKSDYANFGIAVVTNTLAVTSSEDITPYGYDLFELFKQIIEEGKDSYDRIELEEYIDFYVMTFIFDFEMAFELFDLIASQHPHSEIEEEEPTIKEEEDLEIDVEMGVIPEDVIDPEFGVDEDIDQDFSVDSEDYEIDIEMGVIPQEPSDEDFEIDVEMGVEHEDFEIDVEMGVVPLEPSTEEDNTDLEV